MLRELIVLGLFVGLSIGELTKISGTDFNTNEFLENFDYENSIIPQNIMKLIMKVFSYVVEGGVYLSDVTHPHGITVGIILIILTVIRFEWILYPILFIYVLREEKRKVKTNAC